MWSAAVRFLINTSTKYCVVEHLEKIISTVQQHLLWNLLSIQELTVTWLPTLLPVCAQTLTSPSREVQAKEGSA